jgi:hypothetical protein
MTPTTHAATKSRTVYHLKYRPLLLLLAFLMLALGMRTLFSGAPLLFTLLFLFNAGWLFACAHILRIVISPRGIAYHNAGFYSIETSWANVVGIKTLEFPLVGSIPCVVLQESVVTGWTGVAWMLPAAERGRMIPLSNGWAGLSELEQSIQYYIAENSQRK